MIDRRLDSDHGSPALKLCKQQAEYRQNPRRWQAEGLPPIPLPHVPLHVWGGVSPLGAMVWECWCLDKLCFYFKRTNLLH